MDLKEERQPLLKRPWVWIAAATTVVTVVILTLAFIPNDDAGDRPASSTPSEAERLPLPSESSQSESGDVDDLGRPVVVPAERRGVALPQSEQPSSTSDSNPLARPKGLEWQRVYGSPAPFSRSDGPAAISADGVPRGMSRTPQGATIAALQIVSRIRFGTKADRYAVIDQRLEGATESDKQALRRDGDILSITVDDPEIGDIAANRALVPAAFRIRAGNWTNDAATIDIAYGPHEQVNPDDESDVQSVYYWQSLSTVWVDGEWHLKYKPSLLTRDEKEGSMGSLDGGEWATWVR
ncbi:MULTISPECIES: hypothetical protein [Gordonia]|jgi:hypothetical protein|uniref:DUF8175 domain-containing protein n=2 Tax=Gordonia TaxID=2053 RepID=L7LMH7_9ACTN|nr:MULTISPECIES: hypothetical protein [Gordonia]AUH70582.1 hypothetical protein CXX93_19400 [Gordonia sp. YC-JH1]WFN95156.1 hypothetical protein P5P27_20540 [Gordonia sihwensis]GAC62345.1 hypothetical protein GSI01S_33_00310 [Gordonia sihwensis NBRC 108236]